MRINFDASKKPFTLAGHSFKYVKINDKEPVSIRKTEINLTKGFFEATPKDVNQNSYKVEWFDKNDVRYYYGECNNVEQFVPLTPDDPNANPDVTYPVGYQTLVWRDEFNGTAVDTNKWDYDIGGHGWGNGEAQYYTRENATVSDGLLHITAKKEEMGSNHYTSSRMVTRGKYAVKYGYIEAKISLPEIQGMWPAFWMMPENSIYGGWPQSGEIDIMEARGRVTNKSSSALHFTVKDSATHTYLTNEQTFNSGTLSNYHVYACEWKKDEINYFVDGQKHFSIKNTSWQTYSDLDNEFAPFDEEFHMILNLAIGGHFDGGRMPPDDFNSTEMKVDYVRVFK